MKILDNNGEFLWWKMIRKDNKKKKKIEKCSPSTDKKQGMPLFPANVNLQWSNRVVCSTNEHGIK